VEKKKASRFSDKGNTPLDDIIDEMLRKGLIYPAPSATASNILLIKKPNGIYWTCIDYRHLNMLPKSDIKDAFQNIMVRK
jgi:hypothetical protein